MNARVAVAGVAMAVVSAAPSGAVASAMCLLPPVEATVTRPFEAPPCEWCAGHRGITFDVAAGTPVHAAAAGTVTFSGLVVDVRYVVVRHGDGLLATYGGLSSAAVTEGDIVAAGATVGVAAGDLHFGLRTGPDTYIDPEPLIGDLVVPPYLIPTDGTPQRPPPVPRLRCDA